MKTGSANDSGRDGLILELEELSLHRRTGLRDLADIHVARHGADPAARRPYRNLF
jgi:hypothetical protein